MLLRLFFVFLILNTYTILCQNITGVVKDSLTNTTLPYVNITFLKKDKGTYTDDKGRFEIDITNQLNDSLFITCIGYKSKKIAVTSIDNFYISVFLQPVNEIIDEVVLTAKKKQFGSKVTNLISKKKTRFASSHPFGSQIAYLLKNKKNKLGKLKEISFFVKHGKEDKIRKYPAYFRLKFYSYDIKGDKPGELLSLDNILLKPNKDSHKIKVNVEDSNILFPVEGVVVAVEIINAGTPPKNRLYKSVPSLIFTHDKEQKTWTSYRGKQWRKNNHKSVFKNKLYSNLLVNAKVYY